MEFLRHNLFWIIPIIIIDIFLRGYALWKAARNNQLFWFIALIIFNTAGILPLIYLAFFQGDHNNKEGR